MRIILKILAAPVVAAMTVFKMLLTFLFCWAAAISYVLSFFIMVCAIITLVTRETTNGIIMMIFAFLLSPFGLPYIAAWLVRKIDDLNDSMVDLYRY